VELVLAPAAGTVHCVGVASRSDSGLRCLLLRYGFETWSVVLESPRLSAEKVFGTKKKEEREKTGENYVT
jgi:hypothetical protein